MTLKEEARALVNSYLIYFPEFYNDKEYDYNIEKAKQCALISIDFAMNSKYSFQPMHGGWISGKLHYEELKQEIKGL
jgi:hypothetical protein